MKSKTFSKRLTINKKTIVDLNVDKMKDVHGGIKNPTGPVDESVYIGQICLGTSEGPAGCQ
jgi:hypothetical protein